MHLDSDSGIALHVMDAVFQSSKILGGFQNVEAGKKSMWDEW
jgi:hypothetical protein